MRFAPGQRDRDKWSHLLAVAIHLLAALSCLWHLLYIRTWFRLHPDTYIFSQQTLVWGFGLICLLFWVALLFVFLEYRKAVWFLLGGYVLMIVADVITYGKFTWYPGLIGLLTIPLHRKAWRRYE